MNALALLALLLGAKPSELVVARVDGRTITADALASRIAATPAVPAPPQPEQVLSTMIDEALLTAEGVRLGLDRSPIATAHLDALLRKESAALFLEREIGGRSSPDEGTVRAMFHATADFAAFDLVAFASSEEAAAALARIQSGGTFAAEARRAVFARVHEPPAAAPLVMRAELPRELAAPLLGAAEQSLVGPVRLTDGFGVARLLRKVVGTEAELAARRPAIAAHAREQMAASMKQHVMEQLRQQLGVKLDESFLRAMETSEPSAAQLQHVLATVGKTPVHLSDIIDDIRGLRAGGGHMGPSLRVALAWRAIDERIAEQVALERGLLQDPAVVGQRSRLAAEATGYAAAMRLMNGAPPPTKAEVEAFYQRNSASFGRPLPAVRAEAAAGAAREKRYAALADGVAALRQKATISVDSAALARATSSHP